MSPTPDHRVIRFEIGGHQYVTIKHPPQEGLALSLRLLGTGLGALAEAIGALGESKREIGAMLNGDLDNLIAPATKGALGVQRLLEADDAPAFIRRVLAHTSRDGEALSTDAAFERAFAGNYGELYEAVVEVVVGNGFLPGLATWQRLGTRFGLKKAAAVSPKP